MNKKDIIKKGSVRLQQILKDLNVGVYEKETELKLALLVAMAGESMLLLGPPGVAKSMIGRQIKKAFKDARAFEYLMSRFSTPDDIFGPVSISRLKTSDKYERCIDGYLPTADVVFLDEIWKAGPAIQNSLLTVFNEKLFRNGDEEIHIPLKIFIAASNELPAQGEGLEALWDRFIVRVVSNCIKDETAFYKMMLDDNPLTATIKKPITPDEYEQWRAAIADMPLADDVLATITSIRQELKNVMIPEKPGRSIYISDRRWKMILKLVRAAAFMQGHDKVEVSDLLVTQHCLWNEPDECTPVKSIVLRSLCMPWVNRLEELKKQLHKDLRQQTVDKAIKESIAVPSDLRIKRYDNYFFLVLNHGSGHTYMYMPDYMNLPFNLRNQADGIMYSDIEDGKKTIIRSMWVDTNDQAFRAIIPREPNENATKIKLYRDDKNVYINGVRYELDRIQEDEQQPDIFSNTGSLSGHDYMSELGHVAAAMTQLRSEIEGNVFYSPEDAPILDTFFQGVTKDIINLRIDASKLD